jgi:hypothetical protein
MGTAKVKYQYGSYSGTVEVFADPNDDNDVIFARAKKRMFRDLPPPAGICCESYKVIERSYEE